MDLLLVRALGLNHFTQTLDPDVVTRIKDRLRLGAVTEEDRELVAILLEEIAGILRGQAALEALPG
jgi:hypothetical protein